MEMFPALIDASEIDHQVLMSGQSISIAPAKKTATYPVIRSSYETKDPIALDVFGSTRAAPLGYIVHARSGDKANNSNIGFFVRHEDEYSWLRSFLSIDRLKALLQEDWIDGDANRRVERCEFPKIWSVHL
jgi:hypothetical protein